jgi:hypothetical protein
MSPVLSARVGALSIFLLAAAIACGDSGPAAPAGETDLLKDRVQLQSPDTARGTWGVPGPTQGDGFFRGSVMGYSLADLPDTLKSAKPLANVVVTAYPAELTDRDPKLGPAAGTVTTNAQGQFTFATLKGGLYVVTFTPPAGDGHEAAWTLATATPQSGGYPWTIMLRRK